ncbi:hypothetical protein EBQ25_09070 [Allofranklinella schreckenbergeri]|uniref:Uncharacterized protein n=1 Tax=Allofranklinella schreckenbergeri TaxID=1076744 RepID=A0A3M6Q7T8_9BURK|nr:hypothetical protein EBQ25_09070 [Allofranklinella schreckenbergeri]
MRVCQRRLHPGALVHSQAIVALGPFARRRATQPTHGLQQGQQRLQMRGVQALARGLEKVPHAIYGGKGQDVDGSSGHRRVGGTKGGRF